MDDSCSSGKEESSHKGSTHEASENGNFDMDDNNVIHHFDSGRGDDCPGNLRTEMSKDQADLFPTGLIPATIAYM